MAESTMIMGRDLIAWGCKPGPAFKAALELAQSLSAQGHDAGAVKARLLDHLREATPVHMPLRPVGVLPYHLNIAAETPDDDANIALVVTHMDELMRTPMIEAGAVMPDACPAGNALGTIPVGGVVASRAIHPGLHSADICCSVAITILPADTSPTAALNAGQARSSFGPFARPVDDRLPVPELILKRFRENRLLIRMIQAAQGFFATQGDGNHFLFVGRLASTGEVAIVTHHGSRKPGALLYKAGQALAERHTREVSPKTPRHNAWIDPASDDGATYWDALQAMREWTKASHFAIHDAMLLELGLARPEYGAGKRFWNEHNFVFRRGDLYYHAKGATPAYPGFAEDDVGLTMTPLNMAHPVLITRGRDAAHGLGFSPHGAGRNFGRRSFMRDMIGDRDQAAIVAEQTRGIDARFVGAPDLSELPMAYKSADQVRRQIEQFGLADVVDLIEPLGSIMAGEIDLPWMRKPKAE